MGGCCGVRHLRLLAVALMVAPGSKQIRAVGEVTDGPPGGLIFRGTPPLNEAPLLYYYSPLSQNIVHFVVITTTSSVVLYSMPAESAFLKSVWGSLAGSLTS